MDNEITRKHKIYVARKIFFLDDNNEPTKKISARVLQNLENRILQLEQIVKQLVKIFNVYSSLGL